MVTQHQFTHGLEELMKLLQATPTFTMMRIHKLDMEIYGQVEHGLEKLHLLIPLTKPLGLIPFTMSALSTIFPRNTKSISPSMNFIHNNCFDLGYYAYRCLAFILKSLSFQTLSSTIIHYASIVNLFIFIHAFFPFLTEN